MIELTRKQFNAVMRIYQATMIILMFSMIFFLGFIQGKLIESVMCLSGFLLLKVFMLYKLESSSMVTCFIYSILSFACLSRLALPIGLSLTCAPVLGLLMAYVTSKIAKHNIEFNTLISEKQERKNISNKSRRNRAEIALQNISDEHQDYGLILDYVNGVSLDVLADKYSMSESTVNRKINRMTRM